MTPADLKRLQLLAELEDAEREALAPLLEPLDLAPGSVLFDEGETGEGALFLVEGEIRLASSRTSAATRVGPGTALGALSLAASGPREARAETTSRCQLLVLRRSAFRRFCDDEPRAACRLLEAILRETTRLGRAALADAGVDPLAGDD